ncbi:response regulator [Spirosoma rigui]|uniref:response regulator n=1 Tax=Spirosoma rigui TaxID=564064 RepID=UPI0009B0121F|nr:response regulator [Spirosoma rigui]
MPTSFPILLVDDDADVADLLNRIAVTDFPEAVFLHVDSFAQAASYLDNLEGRGPRLVLLDVNLRTGLTGLDFLTLIREHPQGRLVPVVMLSSSQLDTDIHEALNRGASLFTQKPFTYVEWRQYVQNMRLYWYETVTTPNPKFMKGNTP